MKLIDGYNGGIPHIDAQMIRDYNISLYGTGDCVLDIGNKFDYEIVNNNEIKIHDGYAVMQGARVSLSYGQSITANIENGTSGYNRNDIICIKYTKNEETLVESTSLEVVKGTISSEVAINPSTVTGNIRSGAVVHQMPLYRVRLSGTNISGVDKLFSEANLGGLKNLMQSTNYGVTNNELETLFGSMATLKSILQKLGARYVVETNADYPEYTSQYRWIKYSDGIAEVEWTGAIGLGAGVAWAGGYHHTQVTPAPYPTPFVEAPKMVEAKRNGPKLAMYCGGSMTQTHWSTVWHDGFSGSYSGGAFDNVHLLMRGRWQ